MCVVSKLLLNQSNFSRLSSPRGSKQRRREKPLPQNHPRGTQAPGLAASASGMPSPNNPRGPSPPPRSLRPSVSPAAHPPLRAEEPAPFQQPSQGWASPIRMRASTGGVVGALAAHSTPAHSCRPTMPPTQQPLMQPVAPVAWAEQRGRMVGPSTGRVQSNSRERGPGVPLLRSMASSVTFSNVPPVLASGAPPAVRVVIPKVDGADALPGGQPDAAQRAPSEPPSTRNSVACASYPGPALGASILGQSSQQPTDFVIATLADGPSLDPDRSLMSTTGLFGASDASCSRDEKPRSSWLSGLNKAVCNGLNGLDALPGLDAQQPSKELLQDMKDLSTKDRSMKDLKDSKPASATISASVVSTSGVSASGSAGGLAEAGETRQKLTVFDAIRLEREARTKENGEIMRSLRDLSRGLDKTVRAAVEEAEGRFRAGHCQDLSRTVEVGPAAHGLAAEACGHSVQEEVAVLRRHTEELELQLQAALAAGLGAGPAPQGLEEELRRVGAQMKEECHASIKESQARIKAEQAVFCDKLLDKVRTTSLQALTEVRTQEAGEMAGRLDVLRAEILAEVQVPRSADPASEAGLHQAMLRCDALAGEVLAERDARVSSLKEIKSMLQDLSRAEMEGREARARELGELQAELDGVHQAVAEIRICMYVCMYLYIYIYICMYTNKHNSLSLSIYIYI